MPQNWGGGVEVVLPNVSYLDSKNVLFVPGHNGTAVVVYDSTNDKIVVKRPSDFNNDFNGDFGGLAYSASDFNNDYNRDFGA